MRRTAMASKEPFLKWAGGKRWLVKQHSHMFPLFTGRYIEPFLGSGAVYFYLRPAEALLSDKNGHLIETYKVVKAYPNALDRRLSELHALHSTEFYYHLRAKIPTQRIERAARFIYLNRVCWNGLYRVNMKGEFNVPIGSKTCVAFPKNAFAEFSAVLKNADLTEMDFEAVINVAKKDDFVFVDPPYTVSHNNNGFIKYNDVLFSWKDQIRLAKAVARASNRGALVFVSNANHDEILKLYRDFTTHYPLARASNLSGKLEGRRGTSEAAFVNYNFKRWPMK
jgi:DNA adenine methylase